MVDFQAMTPVASLHNVTDAEWNRMVRNLNALGQRRQIETLTRGAATLGYTAGFWVSLFTPQNIAIIPRVSGRVLMVLTVNMNADSMYNYKENDFTFKLNASFLTGLTVRWSASHGNVGGAVTHSASAVVWTLMDLPTLDGVNYVQGVYMTRNNPADVFKIHSARLLVKEL